MAAIERREGAAASRRVRGQRGAPACTSLSVESTLPVQFAQCRLHSRPGWKCACGHADAGADRRSSAHKPGFRSHSRGDAFSGTGLYRRVPGGRTNKAGERLEIDMAIPFEMRDARVPSMLLQPLVENAVRYGVAPLIESGWIAIKSALDANRLRIVIGNSGRRGEGEQKKNGNGIGLGNTAERLKTLYGTDFEFSLAWPEAGGCEVVLELPLRRALNLQEVSPCAL